MEANGHKHLAATVTTAEKDKNDGTDEDLERPRILLGDTEVETGTEAETRIEKGDVINTGTEVTTVNEDLGVRQKKRTAVGVHDTIALATMTPSATAAH